MTAPFETKQFGFHFIDRLGRWAVGLPHQCDEWLITLMDLDEVKYGPITPDKPLDDLGQALMTLDVFISEAQQLRAEMRRRAVEGP